MGKLDRKASEMVFWVCKQIEGAVMRSKNVAGLLSHTMHGSVEAEIGKVSRLQFLFVRMVFEIYL